MARWSDDAVAVIAVITGKWAVLVLGALEDGPRRHNELQRSVGNGIHPKVFDGTLRRLEKSGLVRRDTDPGTPPATWYELTALARSLIPRLTPLALWVDEHRAELASLPGWLKGNTFGTELPSSLSCQLASPVGLAGVRRLSEMALAWVVSRV